MSKKWHSHIAVYCVTPMPLLMLYSKDSASKQEWSIISDIYIFDGDHSQKAAVLRFPYPLTAIRTPFESFTSRTV